MRNSQRPFKDIVPDGWFKVYLEAMEDANNEMPIAFHFLAAAAMMGNMLGLKAWATLARGVRVYPNVNALLLSPAGKCRRGEGTKITMAIARRAALNVFAGKTTPEGLADELRDNGDLILYVEELSMLLTKQDFQRPIIPVLTKLLLHGEGESEIRTRSMGERRCIPYVNLTAIFTSAPDWFMTTIPEEAFGGGLMSRFLVCCLNERDIYHIDIQAEDIGDQIVQTLADELTPIAQVMKGHIRGTNAAQSWIKDWYIENERTIVSDPRQEPHKNRKPANLLRLAMLLSAAADIATLSRDKLEEALAILNWMEPTLLHLYGLADETASAMLKGERRILQKIRAEGGVVLHSDLVRSCASYFKGRTRELRVCMEGLLEKGLVDVQYKNSLNVWPPRSWKLTIDAKEN